MKKTVVSSAYELDKLLKVRLGNEIETEPFATVMGGVEGKYKGEPFKISFGRNQYLLVSISNNGKHLLEQMQPILSGAMGENPICSYDMQSEGVEEKDAMPTIEWDIVDPEVRIKEVVNGRAFPNQPILYNLTLFGERKIEGYLEDEKAKAERIANARIYGIDPGSIKNTEAFKTMSEVDLYFNIDAMGGHIWRCRHDMSHGRIPEIDLTEEQYALEYMVYQTTRFGVELAEPTIDKHIETTPSYNAWYSFYSNHFKNTLTDDQWNDFQRAQRLGQDVSAFMPKGNYQDTLAKSAAKELK
jgi:hypothetical protein